MDAKKINLVVRQATFRDVPGMVALSQKVYGSNASLEEEMIGHISIFPEGQFIAEYNGEIVGHCATFIISGDLALQPHTWREITGHGFASRHDPEGDYLYGMEVGVNEKFRGLRIGQRLYNARKRLCRDLKLKGIVFGGRIPNLARKIKEAGTAQEYVKRVQEKKYSDPVLNFHLRNGFEIIGVLEDYMPYDKDSLGFATHMVWKNPLVQQIGTRRSEQRGRAKNTVRIAAVQYQMRKVGSFEEFGKQVEYFVDVAADYEADFILFPELLTMQLLSAEKKKLTPQQSLEKITGFTDEYVEFMQKLAISYNANIIGGSHLTRMTDGTVENHAYVFLRSGAVYMQPKLHPTPNERYWWNVNGGNKLKAIPTDCGEIGVLVCYDAEFPEPARYLVDQGAKILFVPFCTDERQGYLRVRYCCQARAVENQMYVVMAGVVGNLPDVENMDVHYAESCILTPCDFPFARDGIAAASDANTEMVVFADVKIDELTMSRNSGTTQNLRDRRFDLYKVEWNPRPPAQKDSDVKLLTMQEEANGNGEG
ncbi:MAG: GNAT family N-acetyltransferase [Alphaproteobacteria bacterium]|nr:GNAT family N-acetyltransferase [Alphaproteobacteria bacterium]